MALMWRSKLGGEFARDLIDGLDAKHLRTLKQLRAEAHNAHCADCGRANNTWASVNLGVFLCDRCADVHRALGTHISKVKGCQGTDLWGPDEIALMQELDLVFPNKQMHIGASGLSELTKQELMELCLKKYGMKTWSCKNALVSKKEDGPVSLSLTGSVALKTQARPGQFSAKSSSPPTKLYAEPSRLEDACSNPHIKCSTSCEKEASNFSFDAFFAILEPNIAAADVKRCHKQVPISTTAPPPSCLKRASTDEVFEGFENW